MDGCKKDSVIRDMIKHENDLVNHRISWMSAIQGLLFSALAFSWEKAEQLIPVLCLSGKAIALITIYNCWLATTAIQSLLRCQRSVGCIPPAIGLNMTGSVFKFIENISASAVKLIAISAVKRAFSYISTLNLFRDIYFLVRFVMPYLTMPAVLIPVVFLYAWVEVSNIPYKKADSASNVVNYCIRPPYSTDKNIGLLNFFCFD